MAQQIEFFLHPPSPVCSASVSNHHGNNVVTSDNNTCILPPVSSLLQCNQRQQQEDPNDLPTLCLPSPSLSSSSSLLEPVEPYSSTLNDNSSSPSLSPFMGSLSLDSPPQLSPQTSPYPAYRLLLPPPTNTRRCRSLSNVSTNSTNSNFSQSSSDMGRRLSDPPIFSDLPPTTEPYTAKRKRGRPPNTSRPQPHQRDSWTFVTPTVWDVKQQTKETEQQDTVHSLQALQHNEQPTQSQMVNKDEDFMVLHWPTSSAATKSKDEIQQQGQNTFTNTTMNTALSMPKKKRGRKPKMQLAGNFCFVWRDLTARRGANKKKPTPAIAKP
ncbi:hypothetical protein MAM1_0378c10172 [Mucor ambiguus]|uniref:Uncharacterized protein n=1 Tax=Mucor ambiguus TaxID=91626 RepID=A0A0C9N7I9_9FUNG|nr:hypothetical protein MAM1_0378c10172 [Mucor ambiguus]